MKRPQLRRRRTAPHLLLGEWGETVATRMLKHHGYRILARRYRIGRHDEIDIIARTRDTLIFAEVKTRTSEDFERPRDAVDRNKRFRLSRAAHSYLLRLPVSPEKTRIDIIEVVGSPETGPPVIRHLEGAVETDPRFDFPY